MTIIESLVMLSKEENRTLKEDDCVMIYEWMSDVDGESAVGEIETTIKSNDKFAHLREFDVSTLMSEYYLLSVLDGSAKDAFFDVEYY